MNETPRSLRRLAHGDAPWSKNLSSPFGLTGDFYERWNALV